MWQMCERLRLNKYFNRSEWWSINHRDKLGAIFTSTIALLYLCDRRIKNLFYWLTSYFARFCPPICLIKLTRLQSYTKFVSIALSMECQKWFSTELARWFFFMLLLFSLFFLLCIKCHHNTESPSAKLIWDLLKCCILYTEFQTSFMLIWVL